MMIFSSPTDRAVPVASKDSPVSLSAHRSCKGFTLLEVLVTLVIVALGIMTLTLAINRGMYASANVADLHTATALVEERLEQLKDFSSASIVDESRAAVTATFSSSAMLYNMPSGMPEGQATTAQIADSWVKN